MATMCLTWASTAVDNANIIGFFVGLIVSLFVTTLIAMNNKSTDTVPLDRDIDNETLHPLWISLTEIICRTHCSTYIPREIIQICIQYCFILDEFDPKKSSPNVQIKGINNTIAFFPKGAAIVQGRNVIPQTSTNIYHWLIKVSFTKMDLIEVGLMIENKPIITYTKFTHTHTDIHLYMNMKNNKSWGYSIHEDGTKWIASGHPRKLKGNIQFYVKAKGENINIELISYENTEWLKKRLNDNDPSAYIHYGTFLEKKDRAKHYEMALKKAPNAESLHNEYIWSLMKCGDHYKAFNHAIKFKKGINGITSLIRYYYYSLKQPNETNELLQILNDEELGVDYLFVISSRIAYNSAEYGKAVALWQKYYDKHEYDIAKVLKFVPQMIHSFFVEKQYESAVHLFDELDNKQINTLNLCHILITCYYECEEYDRALSWFDEYWSEYPSDLHPMTYPLLSFCCRHKEDYDKAMIYAQKALKISVTVKDVGCNLADIGLIWYRMGNIEKAIKYSKDAMEYMYDDLYVSFQKGILNNIAVYYCNLDEYDEAYKYVSKAFQIAPDDHFVIGNYGVVLYYMKRIKESIKHLKKWEQNMNGVNYKELDILYIYAKLLYEQNKYEQSIDKCLKAMDYEYFERCKEKNNIYVLLTNNYTNLLQFNKANQYHKLTNQN